MQDVIPNAASFINTNVIGIEPDKNCVLCDNSTQIHYDALVIAAGLELAYDAVDGEF